MIKVLSAAQRSLGGLRGRRLAVSIQGISLRLLLMEGKRIRNWAETPFNPALLRGGFIADAQGMGRLIKNAMASKSIPAAPVVAAFPGYQSIIRVIQLPAARDINPKEVLPREARRLMAFSAETQHFFYQRVPGVDKTQRFVAVAVPKAPLKTFVETLRQADLSPTGMELAPLCLLKSLPQGQAIAANVERDSIDICLVVDSLPAVVRSLWLGDEPLDLESAPSRLAEELGNTINFYNDNTDSPLPEALAVHLAGGFPIDDLAPPLAREVGRPVVPMVPPLAAHNGFSGPSMAVTCGLALGR